MPHYHLISRHYWLDSWVPKSQIPSTEMQEPKIINTNFHLRGGLTMKSTDLALSPSPSIARRIGISVQKQVWLAFGACAGCCFGFPMDNDGVFDGEESLSGVQKYLSTIKDLHHAP